MNRRGLLRGILAAGMAPAIAKAGILMPVRDIIVPRIDPFGQFGYIDNVRFITTPFWAEEMLQKIAPIREPFFSKEYPARFVDFRRYNPNILLR